MRKLLMMSIGILFIMLAGGNVNASPLYYDSYDGNFFINNKEEASWTFNLSKGSSDTGISNYFLSVGLKDCAGDETGKISLDDVKNHWYNFNHLEDNLTTIFSGNVSSYLEDNELSVNIISQRGSFYVDFISLSEELIIGNQSASDDYSPTPEPAAMLLFGFGLLGLAGVVRRKQ